jgi:phosphate transport system permease protein
MTELAAAAPVGAESGASRPSTRDVSPHMSDAAKARLKGRYRAEQRFRAYGLAAISLAMLSLVILLWTILSNGTTAFFQTHIRLEVPVSADRLGLQGAGPWTPTELRLASWDRTINLAMQDRFPAVTSRADRNLLSRMVSPGAGEDLRNMVIADPALIGRTVQIWALAASDIDMFWKGHIRRDVPEAERRVNDRTVAWIDDLTAKDEIRSQFNTRFFTSASSVRPELVGVAGSVIGTVMTLLVCMVLAVPIGVLAAIYLEEYAPKNRITDIIEVNINNLAAVPSIVFGLLGLAVFLNFFGMPRSAPLVGGIVIALMSLPTVIIATRAALRAVPPSIREAALGVGASKMQVILHHVLPLAMPGIMTGTIITLAQALGETAPLLMIGMVAFVTDIPTSVTASATVLPVQIYMWAGSPERGFVEKTSAGIMVLLVLLLAMNAVAIYLRKKFERRW